MTKPGSNAASALDIDKVEMQEAITSLAAANKTSVDVTVAAVLAKLAWHFRNKRKAKDCIKGFYLWKDTFPLFPTGFCTSLTHRS